MKKATLSVKGQITIPKAVRQSLHWHTGQVVHFETRHGMLIGKKEIVRDPLDEVVGILRGKISDVDDYLDELRGPRPTKPIKK